MNEKGGSCYPTVDQQAKETGLTVRAICIHLQKACDAGFIRKKVHGMKGQKWRNHEYQMIFPDGCVLKTAEVANKAQEPDSIPFQEGEERSDKKVRNDVPTNYPRSTIQVSKKERSPLPPKGGESDLFGESKNITLSAKPDRFEEFWKAYPLSKSKSKKIARARWEVAISRHDPGDIIRAASLYAQQREEDNCSEDDRIKYTAMAQTWLNQERFLDLLDGEVTTEQIKNMTIEEKLALAGIR